MLELTSPSPRRCDGVSRRDFLKIGSLGWGGLTLADVLRAESRAAADGRASVVGPLGDLDLARRRPAAA